MNRLGNPSDGRVRRIGGLAACLAVVTGLLVTDVGDAGAISAGSIAPTTLAASQQQFQITYSGKDTSPSNPNLIVEECIADDTKVGFDPELDCSPLSRVNYFGVAESGTITYGGSPSNPTAPFVGIDPNNGEWSVCAPGSGVTNHQSGYFRLADFPADQADDFFIPFAFGSPPPPPPADFDGDGDTDVSVFRSSNGSWCVQGGPVVGWGTTGDAHVSGDYDGDGDADIAVFRPSNGTWYIVGGPAATFGTAGDIPVPGNHLLDGASELSVFRPSTGVWYVRGGTGRCLGHQRRCAPPAARRHPALLLRAGDDGAHQRGRVERRHAGRLDRAPQHGPEPG